MALNYRKSINLGAGVRVNLNKKSVGLSVGGKGLRYSANSSGQRNRTISARGTGLSWRTTSGKRSPAPRPRTAPRRAPAPATAPHPGLFASKAEKQLYKAVTQAEAGTPTEEWAPVMLALTANHKVGVAASLLAGLLLRDYDPQTARPLVSALLAAGVDPATDSFLHRYCSHASGAVAIDGLPLTLGMSRDLIAVLTSQLHAQLGQLDAARHAADQITDSRWTRAWRADLALDAGAADYAITMTDGVTNIDDLATLALAIRGAALRKAGHTTAAQEVLREALRFPSCAASVRHRARLERARIYLAMNQPAKARQDLERILAEDSQYPGVADLLLPNKRADVTIVADKRLAAGGAAHAEGRAD